MTPTRLEELVRQLYRLPPPGDADREDFSRFARALRDLNDDAIEHAFARAERECEFVPAPATIRRLAGVAVVPELTLEARADIAYREAHTARSTFHANASVHFVDALTAATLREMGGWQQFCCALEVDEKWERRDFVRIYQQRAALGVSADQARHLAGWAESSNREAGYPVKPPRIQHTELPPMRGVVCLPLPDVEPKRIPQTVPEVER